MSEAKEKAKLAVVTLVTATSQERIAIAQMMGGQPTKGHDDRRRRRRVRMAFGIIPDVNVFIRRLRVSNGYLETWTMGRKVGDNGVQDAKIMVKRSVEITDEIVDYLISLTENYEVPDSSAESLLDVENMLRAVKDKSYESPPDSVYPGIAEESPDDKWQDVIDNEV